MLGLFVHEVLGGISNLRCLGWNPDLSPVEMFDYYLLELQ